MHRLTYDTDSFVRRRAADALESAFVHVTINEEKAILNYVYE
jgi:hypothetical protein